MAAAGKARQLGYKPLVLSSSIQGEAREVARVHAAILRDAPTNSCLLSGGETTVTVRGQGKGGRNQEFALALALDIQGVPNVVALCAGTDGTDGPTDAAGAIVTGKTITDAAEARTYLADNNSFEFFSLKCTFENWSDRNKRNGYQYSAQTRLKTSVNARWTIPAFRNSPASGVPGHPDSTPKLSLTQDR